MRNTLIVLCVATVAWTWGTGCASDCAKIRTAYEEALEAETPFLKAVPSDGPIHFGVAVRQNVLDEVVDRALASGLEQALTFANKIPLAAGQTLGIETSGKVADIGLYPDKACEACLRVDGRLGGTLAVKLPMLGVQTVPLKGTFSLVAPVEFETAQNGEAAVRLDLAKAIELGKSNVRPEVTQLPPTWWKVIESPLGKLMAEAITKNLKPITLFRFRGPDLEIEGLEIHPARIVADAKNGVVFAGFRTNLDAAIPADDAGIEPRTDLGKNADLAISVDSRVLTAASVAMLRSEKISRSWTREGKPSPDGPVYVTMRELSAMPSDSEGRTPFAVGFRAWNLPSEGKCWWADATATGSVEVRDDKEINVAIADATVDESSLPGIFTTIAKWTSSSFVVDTSRIIEATLAEESIEFPGGKIDLRRARVNVEGSTLWMEGKVAVSDSVKEADAATDSEDPEE